MLLKNNLQTASLSETLNRLHLDSLLIELTEFPSRSNTK